MTTQEIKKRFNSPAFTEAAEVLDMIQRTPQQRDQYELRLKAQRDHRARLQQATADGEARGKIIGRIETLAGLLKVQVTTLDNLSVDELTSIADDLQCQLRDRGI